MYSTTVVFIDWAWSMWWSRLEIGAFHYFVWPSWDKLSLFSPDHTHMWEDKLELVWEFDPWYTTLIKYKFMVLISWLEMSLHSVAHAHCHLFSEACMTYLKGLRAQHRRAQNGKDGLHKDRCRRNRLLASVSDVQICHILMKNMMALTVDTLTMYCI